MTINEYCKSLRGKKIAVLGLGISNLPLARVLLRHNLDVTVYDKSERGVVGHIVRELESLGARSVTGGHYLDVLDADVIFRSPGIMPHVPQLTHAVQRGAVLTSEMEAFFEICPCLIIGVTGSDGKTTTTTLIGEMLRAEGKTVHVGGNIGTPLFDMADEIKPDDFVVVELSSFQLMTMKKSPHVAVVTNIGPNHLDTHSDIDEYISAKRNIYLHQNPGGRLVLNLDNEITRGFAREAVGDVMFFSAKEQPIRGVYALSDAIKCSDETGEDVVLSASDIKIPGAHNVENYMAAIAATRHFVSNESVQKVAREFGGVPHRIEFVRELHGVKYYNNSADSGPDRTKVALSAFDKKIILIAGGKDKGVPFDSLGEPIIKHVKTLVLTGLTADAIRDAVVKHPNYDGSPEIIMEPDFKTAVIKASENAKPDDVVLLSPASTSFDRFQNFAERGNKFKEIVNGLA